MATKLYIFGQIYKMRNNVLFLHVVYCRARLQSDICKHILAVDVSTDILATVLCHYCICDICQNTHLLSRVGLFIMPFSHCGRVDLTLKWLIFLFLIKSSLIIFLFWPRLIKSLRGIFLEFPFSYWNVKYSDRYIYAYLYVGLNIYKQPIYSSIKQVQYSYLSFEITNFLLIIYQDSNIFCLPSV